MLKVKERTMSFLKAYRIKYATRELAAALGTHQGEVIKLLKDNELITEYDITTMQDVGRLGLIEKRWM